MLVQCIECENQISQKALQCPNCGLPTLGDSDKWSLSKIHEKIKNRFWFFRGFIGVVTILSLIPELSALSKYQILKFTHALLISWNQFMSFLGDKIPFLPPIPSDIMNVITFSGFVVVPATILVAKTRNLNKRATIKIGLIFGLIPIYFYVFFSHRTPMKFIESLPDGKMKSLIIAENNSENLTLLIAFYALLVCFFLAVFKFKDFRNGILFCLGGLISLEILYFLHLPILGELMDQFSNRKLEAVKMQVLELPMSTLSR